MFRILAKRIPKITKTNYAFIATRYLSATAASAPTTTSTGATPTVYDRIIHLTFIDTNGARRIVPAYTGDTIHHTAELNGIDIGPSSVGGPVEAVRSPDWMEPLYGEGTTTGFDHVVLGGEGAKFAKPMDYSERRCLEQYWDEDEIYPESRLASQIVLTKEMDGMTVFLPDRLCDDCP